MPRHFILLLSALVAAAPGCAGEERLSRTEFVREAGAICAKYRMQGERLSEPRALGDVPAYLERGIPLARRELAELAELRPPEEDEAEVERLLGAIRTTISELERLRETAEARDRSDAAVATARVEAASARAAELARRYGLDECGAPE